MATEISDQKAEEFKRELAALKVMVGGEGWQKYFLPRLEEKEKERLEGLSAVGEPAHLRAEHVHGYHDAVELQAWAVERIKKLGEMIKEYDRR